MPSPSSPLTTLPSKTSLPTLPAVAITAVGAIYPRVEIVVEVVNAHRVVIGDHHVATDKDPPIGIVARIIAGAAENHFPELMLVC